MVAPPQATSGSRCRLIEELRQRLPGISGVRAINERSSEPWRVAASVLFAPGDDRPAGTDAFLGASAPLFGVTAAPGQATKMAVIAGAILLVAVGMTYLYVAWRVVQARVDEKIREEIHVMGGEIEQIETPGRLDTGPFEKFGFEQKPVFRLAMEMCIYRKVRWRDETGQHRTSWAEVTAWVTFRQIRKVTWKHGLDLET